MKPGWRIVGGVALVATAWWGGPPVLREIDFFVLRRVELVGARYLRVEDVTAALALPEGASVFDPTDGLDARVLALPGVRSAIVRRRLPGTLRIEIEEAEPVALGMHGGALVLLDAEARELPFDPTRFPTDLPIVSKDALVTRVVAAVRAGDPVLYNEIEGAGRVADGVALEAGGKRYMLRGDVTPQEMRAMRAVAQDLARHGRTYRELDGRFRGRILVRGLGA